MPTAFICKVLAQESFCFWSSADSSAEQAAHLQGVQIEHARATEKYAIAVLTDLAKAYEHVDHAKLVTFARRLGFPLRVLRMCLSAYSWGHIQVLYTPQKRTKEMRKQMRKMPLKMRN